MKKYIKYSLFALIGTTLFTGCSIKEMNQGWEKTKASFSNSSSKLKEEITFNKIKPTIYISNINVNTNNDFLSKNDYKNMLNKSVFKNFNVQENESDANHTIVVNFNKVIFTKNFIEKEKETTHKTFYINDLSIELNIIAYNKEGKEVFNIAKAYNNNFKSENAEFELDIIKEKINETLENVSSKLYETLNIEEHTIIAEKERQTQLLKEEQEKQLKIKMEKEEQENLEKEKQAKIEAEIELKKGLELEEKAKKEEKARKEAEKNKEVKIGTPKKNTNLTIKIDEIEELELNKKV